MQLNSITAYRVSDHYSLERTDDAEAVPVLVRAVAGAWITRTPSALVI